MAIRILWDKYETALLIDACARIMAGEESRKDAVTRVSTALRKRAVDSGIEIDDIFRNESGISLQLANLQQLMKNQPDFPTRNNSKLFKDMVQMYNTDREQFNEILAVVKGSEQQVNVKSYTFLEWLTDTTTDYRITVSEQDVYDTEAYAVKKRIIKESIQEIKRSSQLTELKEVLRNDKLFRLFHGRQAQGIDQVLHLYAEYMAKDKSSVQFQQNAEIQSAYTITDEESAESGESKIQQVDDNSNDGEIQADLAYDDKNALPSEGKDSDHSQILSVLEAPSIPEENIDVLSKKQEYIVKSSVLCCSYCYYRGYRASV